MDNDDTKTLAKQLFNQCWDLLEKPMRNADDDAMLLSCAFGSRYHWLIVGTAKEFAISDWMVSRAAAATGYGDLAVTFATRAVDASNGQVDWLIASAAEGMARAYAAAGDTAKRDEWAERAASLVEAIGDAEERALIADQLASVPS